MKGIRTVTRRGLSISAKTEYIPNLSVWKPMAVGMWAWWLHRITGLALAAYLLIHVSLMSIAILKGQELFDSLLSMLMTSKLFLIFDLGLFAAVLIHGINGVRLILFDLGIGIRRQKEIFWFGMTLVAALFIWSFLRILPEIVR